jgi:2,5-diamino-6-(ribosylamino)-4(3H)-pyrimidinone 5'-phosphate reductase
VIHPRPLLGEPRRPDRPFVAINMITTVDGRAAVNGSAVGIGSSTDHRLMMELRAEADVVLHGAGTVRADPLSARVPRDLVQRRVALGLPPQPVGAIVTRSGNVPARHPYYDSATVVYITSDMPVAVEAPTVEVCRVDSVENVLADLANRGARRVLCEGGPTLNSALFAAQLIDEIYLTVAPKLAGGADPLTLVKGPRIDPMLRLQLRSLVEHEGELFLRYAVDYGL